MINNCVLRGDVAIAPGDGAFSRSEDMIFTVHLPIKIVETILDACPGFFFILLQPLVKILPHPTHTA